MPKISRPIVYTTLAAVAAYALFLNTQPETSSTKHVTVLTHATQKADANGVLPEDLHAHFPRYAGGARDPFAPGVAIARPRPTVSPAVAKAGGAQIGWTLTGISAVNGIASALLENSATGDSVFLQPGDRWNGLRVVSIGDDRVLFQNALGHPDSITFAPPAADGSQTALRQPGSNGPLAPYPIAPLRVAPLPTSPASLPVLPTFSRGAPSGGGTFGGGTAGGGASGGGDANAGQSPPDGFPPDGFPLDGGPPDGGPPPTGP